VSPTLFWQDRPTFVTGATGLVGNWLVKHLQESGADVICLVRDWVPQSELVRARLIEQVKVVRGDVRDQALLERVLGEYEIDTVIHLAAQTIVGIANRMLGWSPLFDLDGGLQKAIAWYADFFAQRVEAK
jgi:CDP-glucose 4,6-dehydratase